MGFPGFPRSACVSNFTHQWLMLMPCTRGAFFVRLITDIGAVALHRIFQIGKGARAGLFGLAVVTFAVAFAVGTGAGQDEAKLKKLGAGLFGNAQTAAGGDPKNAVVNAAKSTIDYWLPAIGDKLPDWARRFEFE